MIGLIFFLRKRSRRNENPSEPSVQYTKEFNNPLAKKKEPFAVDNSVYDEIVDSGVSSDEDYSRTKVNNGVLFLSDA